MSLGPESLAELPVLRRVAVAYERLADAAGMTPGDLDDPAAQAMLRLVIIDSLADGPTAAPGDGVVRLLAAIRRQAGDRARQTFQTAAERQGLALRCSCGRTLHEPTAPGCRATLVPLLAERDWRTRAQVRILAPHRSESATAGHRDFTDGELLVMVQWGRADYPVQNGRALWWTTFDVNTAHEVPAIKVQLLEVLEETPPW